MENTVPLDLSPLYDHVIMANGHLLFTAVSYFSRNEAWRTDGRAYLRTVT